MNLHQILKYLVQICKDAFNFTWISCSKQRNVVNFGTFSKV